MVDIGGGTVDIVAHAIVEGNLEEIIPPKGNSWGGNTVNDGFRQFLGCTLGDPTFFNYIGPQVDKGTQISNKRDLDLIVTKEFEQIKCDFGTHYNKPTSPLTYTFNLPRSLCTTYQKHMEAKSEDEDISFDLENSELTLSRRKMIELFEPTIKGIISIVEKVLQEVEYAVENIYLAGGFGGCQYVSLKLQSELNQTEEDFQIHPAPGDSAQGIVHGAVLFRCDPSIIHKRKADATYGINVILPFKSGVHDASKRFWNEDEQQYKCRDIFCTVVESGENLHSGKIYVTDIVPLRKNLTRMSFNIYTSRETDVWYVTDPGVQYLGQFEVNLSGYGLNRQAEVAVDFTHCEIQLRAYDKQNPANEVKIALDFLSNK